MTRIPRVEAELWSNVKARWPEVSYGDYGVDHPGGPSPDGDKPGQVPIRAERFKIMIVVALPYPYPAHGIDQHGQAQSQQVHAADSQARLDAIVSGSKARPVEDGERARLDGEDESATYSKGAAEPFRNDHARLDGYHEPARSAVHLPGPDAERNAESGAPLVSPRA